MAFVAQTLSANARASWSHRIVAIPLSALSGLAVFFLMQLVPDILRHGFPSGWHWQDAAVSLFELYVIAIAGSAAPSLCIMAFAPSPARIWVAMAWGAFTSLSAGAVIAAAMWVMDFMGSYDFDMKFNPNIFGFIFETLWQMGVYLAVAGLCGGAVAWRYLCHAWKVANTDVARQNRKHGPC